MTSRFSDIMRGIFPHILILLVFAACQSQAAPQSAKDSENSLPLRFEVLGNGVELLPLELEYDLSQESKLLIAGVELSAKAMKFRILKVRQMDSKIAKVIGRDSGNEEYLIVDWPQGLILDGELEAITQSGKVIFKETVNSKSRATWSAKLTQWQNLLVARKVNREAVLASPFMRLAYGRPFSFSGSVFKAGMEPFRFCISQTSEEGLVRLCSQNFEVKMTGKLPSIMSSPISPQPARVIAYNDAAKLADTLLVQADKLIQFYAELSSGVTYEFVTKPTKLNLVEMTGEPGAETVHLLAWGAKPSQPVNELNKEEFGFFERLGFQQTIGDLRNFWETDISLKDPVLYFPGKAGGMFKQKFNISHLPSESVRPYVASDTLKGTYVNGAKIFGRRPRKTALASDQNSVDWSKTGRDFTWYFRAESRGEFNKSYLDVKTADHSYRTYYEVFKGYPRELSSRLSGIVSSEGKLVMMGEVAFNYWFEDVFGWTQYYLARHRWGVSAKYFQSLTNFGIGSSSDILKVTTADLKYRLSPGLWNRDESWGLMVGYQKVNYLSFGSAMLGAGLFWARSMPKIFDDWMNLIPFMTHPKWVDAEFITYMVPADSKTTINIPTYALNFHGKVMWTDRFFGEAGFGLKQYNFQDKGTRLRLQFGSLYGTAGIGLNF